MNYKNKVNPELKKIARRVPYHKLMVRWANIFQTISLCVTAVPKEVDSRRIVVEGYQGLKFKTDLYEPAGVKEPLPCLIYAHGGAFSYRASAYHKKLACRYAIEARCRVCFPDYHLTPQYPYPAAYVDAVSLYQFIMEHASALHIDSNRIGVAGDSAGASLAALICNRYEQESLKRPCLQMLIYPVTDITMGTDSMRRFSDTPLWNAKNNRRMWSYYCQNLSVEDRFDASPMHSSLPQSIPNTYIETAQYDCLHDEGVLYGEKLRKTGANVEINETKGTFHGYDLALNSEIAARNIKKRVLFLSREFYG